MNTSLHKFVTSNRVALLLALLAWTITLSSCIQNTCSLIRPSEVDSLITASLPDQPDRNINITEYTVVCLAQGTEQGSWRFISLVALYKYSGTNFTSQFQFECVGSVWTATVNGSDEYIRTATPDATINTTLRTDCALCIDPRQAIAANNSQHCLGELSCNLSAQICKHKTDTCLIYT